MRNVSLFSALCVFALVRGSYAQCDNACLSALKRDLLTDYDRFNRPFEVTKLNVSITVTYIEVDEEHSQFIMNGWTKMMWNDDRLKWNASQFGGKSSVHFMDHEIWQPDLSVYNGIHPTDEDNFAQVRCIVYASGTVLCVPPSRLITTCNINLRDWPYDVQKCMIKLGSWTYSNLEIELNLEKPSLEHLLVNPNWKIIRLDSEKHLKYYPCCVEPYPDIQFNFTIYRTAGLQKAIIVIPVSVVIILTLATFWLPAQCGEKVILQAFNALILVIFSKYFGELLPDNSSDIPIIVKCYSTLLYSVVASLVIGVIVISLARKQRRSNIPAIFRGLIDSWYGSLLGLRTVSATPSKAEELKDAPFDETEASQIVSSPEDGQNSYWLSLAKLIDRSAFLLFLVFYIVLAVEYLV
jgi:nicotinic acetylcholine receptor